VKRGSITVSLLLMVFIVWSCNDTNKHIIDQYFITDFEGERSLTFKLNNGDYIDVVKPSVVEIANDEYFIIVKQHPQDFSKLPNKAVTNYFIIPLKSRLSKFADLNVYGPLTKDDFEIKKRSLKVSGGLTFTEL
jgi:hypothetical protein